MDPFGIHGLGHWARVLENGLELAAATGANRSVVALFAVLHDCRRINDGTDPEHGRRASWLVEQIAAEVPGLAAAEVERLRVACAYHADGLVHDDPTIGTCWDADRLDLGRVGIRPRAGLLCTKAAKSPAHIAAASERAEGGVVPTYVHDEWVGLVSPDRLDSGWGPRRDR